MPPAAPKYDEQLRSLSHYGRRARWYDWANRIAALLRGTSGTKERLKAIARLKLSPGNRVLEVSCGTGTNLRLMKPMLAGGSVVGLDLSRPMLLRARQRMRGEADGVPLVEGEAAHLPFRSAAFDAVFHHGGFAEFGDRAGALAEMMRVAKTGARIVVCDVGVPADRRLSWINRLLLRTQPEYDKPPPVDLLPAGSRDVDLRWIGGGAWYVLEFTNPERSRVSSSGER
jgi:ubiquinone/menaquinone biosynthesis C-methylase UbiE